MYREQVDHHHIQLPIYSLIPPNAGPYVRYSVSVTASTVVGSGDPVEETLYSQEGGNVNLPLFHRLLKGYCFFIQLHRALLQMLLTLEDHPPLLVWSGMR